MVILSIQVAADAKHNFQMSKSKLFISECYANKAGVIKRFRPRARGRYSSTCQHVCESAVGKLCPECVILESTLS